MNFFLTNKSVDELSLDFDDQRLFTDAALENISEWRSFAGRFPQKKHSSKYLNPLLIDYSTVPSKYIF